MGELPAPQTPLDNHPQPVRQQWLRQLGAAQQRANPCVWDLHRPEWSARIELAVEELSVAWHADGQTRLRSFPYGLSRADAEAAILAGP